MQTGDIIKTKYGSFGIIRDFLTDALTYEVIIHGGLFPGQVAFIRGDEMEEIEPEAVPLHLAPPLLKSMLEVVRNLRVNNLPF